MWYTSSLLSLILAPSTLAARAGFHVHHPKATRANMTNEKLSATSFCGAIVNDPRAFGVYTPTFVSFSGNAGDLVSVHFTDKRTPKSKSDFQYILNEKVPIVSSGQLCIDSLVPSGYEPGQYGMLYFEAEDPNSGSTEAWCVDIKLYNAIIAGPAHPAMCAKNNETLMPMPSEYW